MPDKKRLSERFNEKEGQLSERLSRGGGRVDSIVNKLKGAAAILVGIACLLVSLLLAWFSWFQPQFIGHKIVDIKWGHEASIGIFVLLLTMFVTGIVSGSLLAGKTRNNDWTAFGIGMIIFVIFSFVAWLWVYPVWAAH